MHHDFIWFHDSWLPEFSKQRCCDAKYSKAEPQPQTMSTLKRDHFSKGGKGEISSSTPQHGFPFFEGSIENFDRFLCSTQVIIGKDCFFFGVRGIIQWNTMVTRVSRYFVALVCTKQCLWNTHNSKTGGGYLPCVQSTSLGVSVDLQETTETSRI